MFDFSYVNKIETNLAVQSNSVHVKQKIAPLRRKEPKPHSIAPPLYSFQYDLLPLVKNISLWP